MPVESWRASSDGIPAGLPRSAFPGDGMDRVSMATCQLKSRFVFSRAATRACCNHNISIIIIIIIIIACYSQRHNVSVDKLQVKAASILPLIELLRLPDPSNEAVIITNTPF